MTSVFDGHVHLIDSMGDVDRVANAARNSYRSKGDHAKNVKLATRLHNDRHTSPWEFADFVFEIKAPIFVARQWMRHRTASINELSGRYSQLDCDFYHPQRWRAPHSSNRQMSVDGVDIDQDEASTVLEEAYYRVDIAYHRLLELGVAREQARIVLPLATYTQWWWKIDAHNLHHFLTLRLAEDAQYETRLFARAILTELKAAGFNEMLGIWGFENDTKGTATSDVS